MSAKICAICGGPMPEIKRRNDAKRKYCSPACADKAQKKQIEEYRKRSRAAELERATRKCEVCGKPIAPPLRYYCAAHACLRGQRVREETETEAVEWYAVFPHNENMQRIADISAYAKEHGISYGKAVSEFEHEKRRKE